MIKKYLGVVTIFFMFLPGCTKDNFVENPLTAEPEGTSLINLPRSIKAEVGVVFSSSNLVNGDFGGSVILDTLYQGLTGPMKIFAEIKFKAKAFTGTHLVTMMIDNVSGTVSFNPPLVFVRPANLDMKFIGLDLNGMNDENISFVYINPNGNFEPVLCKEIIVNVSERALQLKDAEIKHFSRYGWAR